MRARPVALVVVLGLTASLSGCLAGERRDTWRRGDGPMMVSMSSSEAEYLVEMIPHHEEAVRSATELARSPRVAMREFGEDIVRTQSAQIDQMREWLDAWYPDQREDTAYRPMMRDLSRLTGDALDQAFLEDMVGHHMMAVMMSQHLLVDGTSIRAEVDGLARRISDEQRAEIRQMRRWLATWFDQQVPGRGPG